MSTLRFLYTYMRPYLVSFAFGMLLLIASSAALLLFPFLTGQIVNDLLGQEPWLLQGTTALSLVLIAVLALRSLFSFGNSVLFSRVSLKSSADLRQALYSRIIRLPMPFFDRTRTGELLSRVSGDVEQLQHSFSFTAAELVRQCLVLFFGIAAIFFITPQLTGFMLMIVPPVMVAALLLGRSVRWRSRQTRDAMAAAHVVVEETLQAVETVKSYSNEPLEDARYAGGLGEAVSQGMRTAVYRAAIGSFLGFCMLTGMVAIIWYGAGLIGSGLLAVGDLVTFVLYTGFIGGSIAGLGNMVTQLQKTVGACERIEEIMTVPTEATEFGRNPLAGAPLVYSSPQANPVRDAVILKGVSFSYPTRQEQPVFENLDIRIGTGERVGLVGASGAGKSTIFRLLLRMYLPDSGSISVLGCDAHELELKQYRQQFAVVPQEVLLFGSSIRHNIAYGKPGATDEQVMAAAELANAAGFIREMPHGLDTRVGERGTQLSGGQRQRIAIARAILRDAPVLLMDEATSALDTRTEHAVQEALQTLMQNRTTLVIAHRLSTVQQLDRVIVLDHGIVVEEGDPKRLLRTKHSVFAKMHELHLLEKS